LGIFYENEQFPLREEQFSKRYTKNVEFLAWSQLKEFVYIGLIGEVLESIPSKKKKLRIHMV
jgi:hypothetical protein